MHLDQSAGSLTQRTLKNNTAKNSSKEIATVGGMSAVNGATLIASTIHELADNSTTETANLSATISHNDGVLILSRGTCGIPLDTAMVLKGRTHA